MAENELFTLQLLSQCHTQSSNAGWWSDCPLRSETAFKWYIATKLCLIHSEIDEAAGLGDDEHLPHRSAFEVELADTVIRALDLIGFLGVPENHVFAAHITPVYTVHELLLELHEATSMAMEHFRKGREALTLDMLHRVVAIVSRHQEYFGVDVHAAMVDKLTYNAKRADHKLVNRQAAGGKSF